MPPRKHKPVFEVPTDDAHETETVAPSPDPEPVVDEAVETACDNHPDRPATFVTAFPWAAQQHLCDDCTPMHYRYAGNDV